MKAIILILLTITLYSCGTKDQSPETINFNESKKEPSQKKWPDFPKGFQNMNESTNNQNNFLPPPIPNFENEKIISKQCKCEARNGYFFDDVFRDGIVTTLDSIFAANHWSPLEIHKKNIIDSNGEKIKFDITLDWKYLHDSDLVEIILTNSLCEPTFFSITSTSVKSHHIVGYFHKLSSMPSKVCVLLYTKNYLGRSIGEISIINNEIIFPAKERGYWDSWEKYNEDQSGPILNYGK